MAETRACKRCSEDYEPQYRDILGVKMLRGAGHCPACAKALYDEAEAGEKAKAKDEVIAVRTTRILQSGIPLKFQTATFDTFDKGWQDKAKEYCERYAQIFPIDQRPAGYPSLYLWSAKTWGVGKTHLGCAVALRIIYRWVGGGKGCPRIYFVSESDLFRQIQATYSFNREQQRVSESEDDILKRLIYCDLLILDDVGKERRSDPRFVQRTLFGLIDGRYKLQLPMILTANVNADGLKAHLEDASFDRFFEMTGGKYRCMDGDSYRRGKRQ